MLYRLVEHYDTNNDYTNSIILDKEVEKIYLNECFVCLDSGISNEKLIKLKNQILYFKICVCDGYIHDSCLNKWYKLQSSCPICRTHICKLPSFKTRIITYFFRNRMISFIYIKINQFYINFVTCNVILKNVSNFVILFSIMFFLTYIYAEIIRQIMNRLDTIY